MPGKTVLLITMFRCLHTHTYIHTQLHRYIHPYIHASKQAYMYIYRGADTLIETETEKQTDMHACANNDHKRVHQHMQHRNHRMSCPTVDKDWWRLPLRGCSRAAARQGVTALALELEHLALLAALPSLKKISEHTTRQLAAMKLTGSQR